jgi:hypothetical protein
MWLPQIFAVQISPSILHMRFWRNNKEKRQALTQQIVNKADVLTELKLCCAYFERNIQNNPTFEPEFKASKIINSILETKQVLTETDVTSIVKLMKDIDKM